MEKMSNTTEAYITWLYQVLLTVINKETNGVVHHKYKMNNIDTKIHSESDNNSPHFAWYGKRPIIHELRKFGFDIYPITSPPKKLDKLIKAGLFMGYITSRETMNCCLINLFYSWNTSPSSI